MDARTKTRTHSRLGPTLTGEGHQADRRARQPPSKHPCVLVWKAGDWRPEQAAEGGPSTFYACHDLNEPCRHCPPPRKKQQRLVSHVESRVHRLEPESSVNHCRQPTLLYYADPRATRTATFCSRVPSWLVDARIELKLPRAALNHWHAT